MTDYPPELDEVAAEADTPMARIWASGVPYPWTWWSHLEGSDSARATELLKLWATTDVPNVYGVLLHGGAGLGKTGIAVAVVTDAAKRRVGSPALWFLATAPKVVDAVRSGDFRKRPAPATFYRWRDLKSRLDRAKVGLTRWDENPPLTAEKVLEEIECRCDVLALDDVDVDALTPWKEEVMLRLLELPTRGKRLIVTMNVDPASREGVARLGERVVDRLMDPALFARFYLTGRSIRRRTA